LAIAGPRLPGHGTRWEDLGGVTWLDWEREAAAGMANLAGRCHDVIVVGLSVGGTLALHLGAQRPDKLRGVIAINPLIRRPEFALAPAIRLFTKSVRGIGNDIKKPGQDEVCYDRIPVRAISQLRKLMKRTDAELPALSLPLLVMASLHDHTVRPSNAERIMRRAGSERKDLVRLGNSYHVATLDYDAETIRDRTLEFLNAVCSDVSPSA
jgi:carboxylesterase